MHNSHGHHDVFLFVYDRVEVKGLYKCVWGVMFKPRNKIYNMADLANTRVYCRRNRLGSNGDSRSPVERARARRRRRIDILRKNSAPAEDDTSPSGQEDAEEGSAPEGSVALGIPVEAAQQPHPQMLPVVGTPVPPQPHQAQTPPVASRALAPAVGVVALAGRLRLMEDAIAVRTNLCCPQINRRLPIHYFGVFDGHGGSHFAVMCKQKLHEILREELMGVPEAETQIGVVARPPQPPPGALSDESHLQETWRVLMGRVFWRSEMTAQNTCFCGTVGFQCRCGKRGDVSFAGTTAVAVVLTQNHIVAGNVGDSRAVLYRGGRIIPLTFDHKPDKVDEKARIEASGGVVIMADTARVQGILAMSRAIGDMYLKPYVISEPQVTFTRRDEDDDFLIIATDGLWDVMTADMAGRVARGCLQPWTTVAAGNSEDQGQPEGEEGGFQSRTGEAALLLVRLALARNSTDNVSVVVVDLRRQVAAGDSGV